MIHIEGRNISPYLPDDPHLAMMCAGDRERFKLNIEWRRRLGEILEKIIHGSEPWKDQEVTCWFGHDPSVPTDPYPTALFVVRLPRPAKTDPFSMLNISAKLAKKFCGVCGAYLNTMRGTDDARVQIDIEVIDDKQSYSTPKKK